MKKIKKVLSLLLCLAAVISISMPVHAAEIKNSDAAYSTVTHTVDAEWISSIPAYVLPEEQGKQNLSAYSVSVENVVLSEDTSLSVSVEYDGSLTERSGVELPYALYNSAGEIKSGSKILTKEAGDPEHPASVAFGATLTEKVKYAGVYTDTAVFSFKVAEKTYTSEEIEADDHLFGIGKTKSEYVVAKFNEDFTEVTIFKNGEDSDGLMMDWNILLYTFSPMYDMGMSLEICTIQDGVLNIGNEAFVGCPQLSKLSLPQSIESIGNYAFSQCTGLTGGLILPSALTRIGDYAFQYCSGLTGNLKMPNALESIGEGAFQFCSFTGDLELPDSIISIGEGAFESSGFTGILKLPNSLSEIMRYTFDGCGFTGRLELPDTIISIGENAFGFCYRFTGNLNLPNTLQDIGAGAFRSCGFTGTLKLPDSVLSIGNDAFVAVSFSDFDVGDANPNYMDKNGVLFNKEETELICYPCGNNSSDYSIPNGTTSIRKGALSYNKLQKVMIPKGITSIKSSTFSGCHQLSEVTMPESITDIDDNAFIGCYNLTTIYGASDSYAQTWAESKGYTFVAQ